MGVAMVLCAIWVRKDYMKRLWPLLLVLPIVFHFAAPGAEQSILKTFGNTSTLTKRAGQGGSGRLADIKPGFLVWKERPFTGIGLGVGLADTPITNHYKIVSASSVKPMHSLVFDNQYMSALVFMGLLGVIGMVWFVVGAVVKLGRTARRQQGLHGDLVAACAISAAGFAMSLGTFDAFAFVQDTLVFFMIVAIGLTVRRTFRAE
jgi:O-antigen ligase